MFILNSLHAIMPRSDIFIRSWFSNATQLYPYHIATCSPCAGHYCRAAMVFSSIRPKVFLWRLLDPRGRVERFCVFLLPHLLPSRTLASHCLSPFRGCPQLLMMCRVPLDISCLSDYGRQDLRIVTASGVLWTHKLLVCAMSRFLCGLLLGIGHTSF